MVHSKLIVQSDQILTSEEKRKIRKREKTREDKANIPLVPLLNFKAMYV